MGVRADAATTRSAGPGRVPARPHLLIAHPSAELYGADRQVLQTVREFAASGWRVTVVLPEGGADAPLGGELARIDGVEVRTLRTPVLRRALLRPAGLVRLIASTPATLWRQVTLVRRLDPDAVLVNTVTLPHWTAAARLALRPVVVHVHEAEAQGPPWARTMLYRPLRAAHRVVANSAATRRVIAAAAPAVSARTKVVPNGVPDAGPQRRSATVPGRLTVVSRLSPRKGIGDAIDALRLLLAAGHDLTLELCGSVFAGYEWFEDELRRRVAAEAGLRDRVIFAGFVTSAAAAFARAQIVLAPSHGESFGNSVVEAMLAERPVVAADVQALAEIVDDGRTGLLTPVGDAAALAAAVTSLLDDPGTARRLAEAGRREAVERYAPAAYGRALQAVVVDAIDARCRRNPPDAQRRVKPARIVAMDIASKSRFCRVGAYRRHDVSPEMRG